MNRLFAILCVATLGAALVQAQSVTNSNSTTATGTNTTSLASQTPQVNASAGSITSRRPGAWVQAAIARHTLLLQQRLHGTGQNQQSNSNTSSNSSTSNSSSTLNTTALTNLLSLYGVNSSNVSGLLGSLTGTGS